LLLRNGRENFVNGLGQPVVRRGTGLKKRVDLLEHFVYFLVRRV
jgi:hypothetical protein